MPPSNAGSLHSANRFYNTTPRGGLHRWDAKKTSTAKRTHALCMALLDRFI